MEFLDGAPTDYSDVKGMIALMALWLVVIAINDLWEKIKKYRQEKYLFEHTPWRLDWVTRTKWEEKQNGKR